MGWHGSICDTVQETPRPVFTTRVEGFKVSWDIPTGAIDKRSQNTKKLSRNETVLWLLPVVVRMRHYAIELSFGKDHEVIPQQCDQAHTKSCQGWPGRF